MIGIKHIEFLVSDLRQSMVFYGGVLEIIGWKRVSENGFKVGDNPTLIFYFCSIIIDTRYISQVSKSIC